MTAYQRPAEATAARLRCSASTRTREVTAISSQQSNSVPTLAAAGTSTIDSTNSGNTDWNDRAVRPCAA